MSMPDVYKIRFGAEKVDIMEELSFKTKVISGHRITIRGDVYEELHLKKGDKVNIVISAVKKQLVGEILG